MKNYKKKIYHKLINNKVSYSSKTIDRYKKNNDKKSSILFLLKYRS